MALQKCGLNLNHAKRELQPHGTAGFPCAAYASSHTSSPDDIIPWHWHEEMEIILITEGRMELRIPGETFCLEAGDMAILNGNILHYGQGALECSLQSFVFSPLLTAGNTNSVFFENYIHPLMKCPEFTCFRLHHDQQADQCFSAAFEAVSGESFAYEFAVREQLSHILLKLYQFLKPNLESEGQPHTTDAARVESMMAFIHEHYAESITLNEIAASANIGEREALRCFKRSIGESPIQYLLKYRLMQSAHLLATEHQRNLSDIALACGFEAPSYYARQFKRFYQCTPREYRKKSKQA